jgi:asparagine synthase (glutamine-hydrolysing)
MCGIAGFVGMNDQRLLQAMCDSLTHRGPDDSGLYVGPDIGLAMRRLAIIDVASGHQPIANEDQSLWVILNGEIYNYEALRRVLAQAGHTLQTASDTETLVHLYEDHGLDFVNHLRGMFGLALWDATRRRLVLARDRVGEKPLYYASDGHRLLFGSEIKAILQARGARAIDPQAVCDYLAAGYLGGSRTFYAGIFKLPPGHLLVHENGQIRISRYWRPTMDSSRAPAFADAVGELSSLLKEAVRLCLRSDVEVGALLSGGIDSSVIVALMRAAGVRVKTFSVGYDGAAVGFNELHHARRVARLLDTQHHELILGPHASIQLLPRVLWHYDEPNAEPTSILVYLLSEFTRKHVKVALSGTGGDELFFGYPRHVGIRLLSYYRWLPRLIRERLVESVVSKWPEATTGSRFAKRAKRFLAASNQSPAHAYLEWASLLHKDLRVHLVSEHLKDRVANPTGDVFLRDFLVGAEPPSLLGRAAALDLAGYLPEYQLTYMDRMSMAHGLEVRAPFCDYTLVDHVVSLPESYRLKRLRTKHILKEAARAWIPSDVSERSKVGFDSPIGQWFKDELRVFLHTFLARAEVARSGLLNPDSVEAMIIDHLSGRRDYSLQLWSLLTLEAWYRMYIEDEITDGSDYGLRDLRGASDGIPLVSEAK